MTPTEQERRMLDALNRQHQRQLQSSGLTPDADGTALTLGNSLRELGITSEMTASASSPTDTLLQRAASMLSTPENVTAPQRPTHVSTTHNPGETSVV